MIRRQQTQLKQFFSEDKNPILVVSAENQLEQNNDKATELFCKCGCLEVGLATRIFKPLNDTEMDLNLSDTDAEKVSINDILKNTD